MKLRFAGATDIGRKRKQNQDRFLIQPEDNLFVVCDGMGGHLGGEVASQMAVDDMANFFIQTRTDDEITWPYRPDKRLSILENKLTVSIKWANWNIFHKAAEEAELSGMGTTSVAIAVDEKHLAIAHVGDSRCYRIRGGEITQLTTDHSLLEEYKKYSALSEEEIANFAYKNVITRSLGMKVTVLADTQTHPKKTGDLYLLCCDGLYGELEDPQEILHTINEFRSNLDEAATELIARANRRGGRDNITVVLVELY
ncbi:Stp1/IreP family PP2C-type Ser/Thr phosphatase [Myxococcota bacterium]|nr:Stp1/IreP family PP2C-type Ser/Thr phosphatase [Myxococcota bacterium]